VSATDELHITSCWQFGFHAYAAGPCFDSKADAVAYRDKLDAHGITWHSQEAPWPILTKPHKEEIA